MSTETKKENLKKNISAINEKIKKLELQRELYKVTLNSLENSETSTKASE